MNIKSRLDRIAKALGSGRLWDGATMETLSECGYFDPDGPDKTPSRGLERMLAYVESRCVLCDVVAARRRPDDQEARERAVEALDVFDLAPDADLDAIVSSLMAFGRESGFSPIEMDAHRDSLAQIVNQAYPD
jgi:hypothetical protein